MNTVELKQKKGISSRHFILSNDRLYVETKSVSKKRKYEVRLDKLGFDVQYESDNTFVGKIFFWSCIAILIAITIWYSTQSEVSISMMLLNYICWGGIAVFSFAKQHEDNIYITGGEHNVAFFRNKPNEEEVLRFINLIKSNTKVFLKQKYTMFDSTTPEYVYFNNLKWLLDNDVIDYDEFILLKAKFEAHHMFE